MPILTVHHRTTYRYRRPVGFGDHRMMFRPRDAADQRQVEARLDIWPRPCALRWSQDVFGNNVAVASFRGRAAELTFENTLVIDHTPVDDAALRETMEPYAQTWPFSYDHEEMPDLLRSVERQHPDPKRDVDEWARSFVRGNGPSDTLEVLAAMTRTIRRQLTYRARHEPGIQTPATTLRLGTGTCRDYAVLMMEAARCLGFAARFISGYIYVPRNDAARAGHRGGGNTHAWLQVYLPGAGWAEFDPTNGIVGTKDLIRVAVVRDPAHAVPLSGSWTGNAGDCLGMDVAIRVTSDTDPAPSLVAVPASA